MDLTHKIVRRLLRDDDVGFSRNKNFDAYEDPMVKRAFRIYRHLRSIERDLLSASDGSVEIEAVLRSEGRVTVRLSFPSGGGKRHSYLTNKEWELLVECQEVSDVLRRLLDDASAETQNRLATSG